MTKKITLLLMFIALMVVNVNAQLTTDGLYTLECVGTSKFMGGGTPGGNMPMLESITDDCKFYIVANTANAGKYNIISMDEQYLASSDGGKGTLIENTETNRNDPNSGALVDLIDEGANPYRIESYPAGVQKAWNGQRTSNTGVGNGTTVSNKYEWNLNRIGDMPALGTAPTDIMLTATLIIENTVAGSTVGTLSAIDADAGDNFTYDLVSGDGTNDVDNAAFTISGSELKIVDAPDFETKATYKINIQVKDRRNLTYTEAFTITVTDVDEAAPNNIALSSYEIEGGSAIGAVVGALSANDGNGILTFNLVAGNGTNDADNAKFAVSGTNLVTAVADFDYNATPDAQYKIFMQVTDAAAKSSTAALSITLIPAIIPNTTPSDIILSTNVIAENAALNTVIGVLSTTDADVADTHIYTFVAGAGDTDNASFIIDGNELKLNVAVDFETKIAYSVRIETKDGGDAVFAKAFDISVTNVNETPTDIALSANTVAENVALNTVIGALSTTDEDAGDTHIYTFASGTGDTDNASFIIDGNELKLNTAVDFETKAAYSVRIETKDADGEMFAKEFAISVTDVNENEAPTNIALSANTIAENAALNTVVGTLTTTDINTTDTHTYSLVAGAGDTDNTIFVIDGNEIKLNAAIDFETKTAYSVRIETKDGDDAVFAKAFDISVTDANDAPTDIALSAMAIDENVAAGTTVGTLSATDEDAADTFTYTLVAGNGTNDADNAAFVIDGTNLNIVASPDFETKATYSINVKVSDATATFTKAFTITINDLTETSISTQVLSNVSSFPNPVVDVLTVNGLESNAKASIYTISGKLLQVNELNAGNNNVDFSNFSEGIYILEVKNSANQVYRTKVVK